MKIICVGLNYQSHNEEMGRDPLAGSETPVIFIKPETALLPSTKDALYIPDFTKDLHYEAEIVVKVCKVGKNIAERFAHRYYDEVSIGIDFTARDLQAELKKKSLPWEISKGFDNSAVIGNFIALSDTSFDIHNLDFQLNKNNSIVQNGNTSNMIHSVDKIVAYASKFFTLKMGDLIFTGTPAGVGRVDVGDNLIGYIGKEKLLDLKIC